MTFTFKFWQSQYQLSQSSHFKILDENIPVTNDLVWFVFLSIVSLQKSRLNIILLYSYFFKKTKMNPHKILQQNK